MERFSTPIGILILGLVYFVWPVDLIPDVFGPIGRIDDVAVGLLVAWRLIVTKRKAAHAPSESSEQGMTKTTDSMTR